MTTLREAIKEKHDIAEKTAFANHLFSGTIKEDTYASFLYNLYLIYNELENHCKKHNLLEGIEDICRSVSIKNDLDELPFGTRYLSPITKKYINYILDISYYNSKMLLAHVYVRHFGDMFGGQIIKKAVPGSGTMYDFKNKSDLIAKTRAKLDMSLAEEANVAMQYAIDLFEDMANEFNIRKTDSAH